MSALPPCCEATTAWVREHATAASCPDCGEQYGPIDRPALLPAAPTVETHAPRRPSQPGAQPDARVQVADEGRLRPSTTPVPPRESRFEELDLVRVRRLLTELRPDKAGPLGWAADALPPAAVTESSVPPVRVQTSVDVPAILPGAFMSEARSSRAPEPPRVMRVRWTPAIDGDLRTALGLLDRGRARKVSVVVGGVRLDLVREEG